MREREGGDRWVKGGRERENGLKNSKGISRLGNCITIPKCMMLSLHFVSAKIVWNYVGYLYIHYIKTGPGSTCTKPHIDRSSSGLDQILNVKP